MISLPQIFKTTSIGAALLFSVCSLADASKRARSNDVASEYLLKDNGDLFRTVNGNSCQITNRVESMKVSQHPNDAAVLYYKKDNDLYVLHNHSGTVSRCPKTNSRRIMSAVKKYNVVNTIHTNIVNTAIDRYGKFVAWDELRAVATVNGVKDYQMHANYGQTGKPFSSYVAFLINPLGQVYKLKGKKVEESKWDTQKTFADLHTFKNTHSLN